MDSLGFYVLLAGVWCCVALAGAFLYLYRIDLRKENEMPGPIKTLTSMTDQVGDAVDEVIESGLDQSLNFQVKAFKRIVGIEVRLRLLTPDESAKAAKP